MNDGIQNLVVLADVFSSTAAFGNGYIVSQYCLDSGNKFVKDHFAFLCF